MAMCPLVPPWSGSSGNAFNGRREQIQIYSLSLSAYGGVSDADNPGFCPARPTVSLPGRGVKLSAVKLPQTYTITSGLDHRSILSRGESRSVPVNYILSSAGLPVTCQQKPEHPPHGESRGAKVASRR